MRRPSWLRMGRSVWFLVDADGRLRAAGDTGMALTFLPHGLWAHTQVSVGAVLQWEACSGLAQPPAGMPHAWGVTHYAKNQHGEFGVAVAVYGVCAQATEDVYRETMPLARRLARMLDVIAGVRVLPLAVSGPMSGTADSERSTLTALTALFMARPHYRPRLDDPERVAPLAMALSRRSLSFPPRFVALAPSSSAVVDALEAAGLTYPFGRPLSAREVVPFDEALARTRAALEPGRVVKERKLRKLVRQLYTHVEPWPFAAIVD